MKEKQSGGVDLPETALVVRAMLNWIYAGSHCYAKPKETDVVAILSLLDLLIACYAAAEKYSTFAWKTVLVTLFTTWAKCAATVLTDDSSARQHQSHIMRSIRLIYECTLQSEDPFRVVAAKYAHKLASLDVVHEVELKHIAEKVPGFGVHYMLHLRAILDLRSTVSKGHQWYDCGSCGGELAYSLGAEVKTCGSCVKHGGLRRIEFKKTVKEGEDEEW
jgi:hypothetical protein